MRFRAVKHTIISSLKADSLVQARFSFLLQVRHLLDHLHNVGPPGIEPSVSMDLALLSQYAKG